jgi:hypothetical protein
VTRCRSTPRPWRPLPLHDGPAEPAAPTRERATPFREVTVEQRDKHARPRPGHLQGTTRVRKTAESVAVRSADLASRSGDRGPSRTVRPTENRGVPGSSPGLAILANPAVEPILRSRPPKAKGHRHRQGTASRCPGSLSAPSAPTQPFRHWLLRPSWLRGMYTTTRGDSMTAGRGVPAVGRSPVPDRRGLLSPSAGAR